MFQKIQRSKYVLRYKSIITESTNGQFLRIFSLFLFVASGGILVYLIMVWISQDLSTNDLSHHIWALFFFRFCFFSTIIEYDKFIFSYLMQCTVWSVSHVRVKKKVYRWYFFIFRGWKEKYFKVIYVFLFSHHILNLEICQYKNNVKVGL